MPTKQQFGRLGEQIARAVLERKGYCFVASNLHSRYGEIDLLMTREGRPVCVEVKFRTSLWFGRPEDSVSYAKRAKIQKTWYSVRAELGFHGPCRIEVVSLLLQRAARKVQVWHFDTL